MQSYLNIDTDTLSDVVKSAEMTNSQIEQAQSLLNQVVIHGDWIFNGKTHLDNLVSSFREESVQIRDNSAKFYVAIQNASNSFNAEEQEQIARNNSVDELLSGVLNVVRKTFHGPEISNGSNVSIVNFENMNSSISGNINGGAGRNG